MQKGFFGNRFRSCDLGVMGPARYLCAIPNADSSQCPFDWAELPCCIPSPINSTMLREERSSSQTQPECYKKYLGQRVK